MLSSLIFMAALATQSSGATESAAAPPPAAAPAASPPAKPQAPKKVCVEEPQLGSHFKRRICATPEEWEKRRQRDAEALARPGSRETSYAGESR